MTPILEARQLHKHFGRVPALDGLDLVAEPGQVTCILGPNGAGKSTFLRMVATLVAPDAGDLVVAGIDALRHPAQVRRAIGLAGQSAAVEGAMTGLENLELIARLYGHRRRDARRHARAVLEQLGLSEDGDRLVRTYSGGMRRRLDLGASLVGAPKLLLLDEPTTGLDPRSRRELWECVRGLVDQGTDVLLTTQYLDEADHLAAHIVIIDRGRVIAEGSPTALKDRAGSDVIEITVATESDLPPALAALAPLAGFRPVIDAPGRRITISVEDSSRLGDAGRALHHLDRSILSIGLRRPTLDEVFLALTGPAADHEPAATPHHRPAEPPRLRPAA